MVDRVLGSAGGVVTSEEAEAKDSGKEQFLYCFGGTLPGVITKASKRRALSGSVYIQLEFKCPPDLPAWGLYHTA